MFAIDDIHRYTPFAKTLAKYSAGVLFCLQTQSAPAFPDTRNIHKDIVTLLQEKKLATKGDPLYSLDMTPEDKKALRMPLDEAIKTLDSLINKDAATKMAGSFLQSRRYLRLGNRYLQKGYSTSATKSYMLSLDILEKIQDKLPVKEVQEHSYKLYLQLAKTNAYQDKSQDKFLHEQGIEFAQLAQDRAEQLMQANPENSTYFDRYYNTLVRKASLHTNAGQYGTANMLYSLAQEYYQEKERNEDIAIIYRNKAAIEYQQEQFQEALTLMEQADTYFQIHFTQTGQSATDNYKIFLLTYGTYLLNTLHLQQAKGCLAKQDSIPTENDDIKLLVNKLDLSIKYIEAVTYEEKLAVQRKRDENDEKQKEIDKSKENGDARTNYETDKALKEAETQKTQRELAGEREETAVSKAKEQETQKKLALSEAETQKTQKEAAEDREKTAQAQTKAKAAQLEVEEKEKQKTQLGLLFSTFIAILLGVGARQYKKKNRLIQTKNEELEEKKKLIEEQKEHIEEGVQAAAGLQEHQLKNARAVIKEYLSDHFIFHSPHNPKLQVSGDFYRATHVDNKTYLLTGDSTGHGTRGAMTSLTIMLMLKQLVLEEKQESQSPGAILDLLRHLIKQNNEKITYEEIEPGQQGEVEQRDGMDATLCVYDSEMRTLQFAGGNHSVYVLRKNEENVIYVDDAKPMDATDRKYKKHQYENDQYKILEYKTNRQPIGDHAMEVDFDTYTIHLKSGDIVYTLSDGYGDQFGGPDNKKIMMGKVRETLLSLGGIPLKEQKTMLADLFNEWKGDNGQTDDVLVIGVQVP